MWHRSISTGEASVWEPFVSITENQPGDIRSPNPAFETSSSARTSNWSSCCKTHNDWDTLLHLVRLGGNSTITKWWFNRLTISHILEGGSEVVFWLVDSCAIKNMSKVLRQICGSKLVLGGIRWNFSSSFSTLPGRVSQVPPSSWKFQCQYNIIESQDPIHISIHQFMVILPPFSRYILGSWSFPFQRSPRPPKGLRSSRHPLQIAVLAQRLHVPASPREVPVSWLVSSSKLCLSTSAFLQVANGSSLKRKRSVFTGSGKSILEAAKWEQFQNARKL